MDIEQKAARARRLLNDEHFQTLISEIREAACARFLNSALHDDDARRNALIEVKGIEAVMERLQADIDRETKSSKDQHREND